MIRSTIVGFIVVVCVAQVASGLRNLSTHWERKEETIRFRPQNTKLFEIQTVNGTVEFAGQNDSAKEVEIIALRKAGANSPERAKQALDALEVTVDGKASEICRLGWRWRTSKEPDWSATVNFTVRAPKKVNVNVETNNGRVTVKNLAGNAKIATTNGLIDTQTTGETLDLQTTNGHLTANFVGRTVKISTTNGKIAADLSRCQAVEGELTTTNGLIDLTVGPKTACELDVSTTNGSVRCEPGLKRKSKSRGSLHGVLGTGGGSLSLRCTNGAIRVHEADSDRE